MLATVVVIGCDDARHPLSPRVKASAPDESAEDGPVTVEMQYPEGGKPAVPDASLTRTVPAGISATLLAPAGVSRSVSAASYEISDVPFAFDEGTFANRLGSCDDCTTRGIPLPFPFVFYGNTYNKIDISTNGIVGFSGVTTNTYVPQQIPYNDGLAGDDNIIALAWSDWYSPGGGAVYYDVRGTAPNRSFIVYYAGVPEYAGTIRLTAQLVLSEGTNEITMYVKSLPRPSYHVVTQGIENSTGTEAAFKAGRVLQPLTLTNDAVRFSPGHSNTPPTITAPANVAFVTDPGACTAAVASEALGTPTFSDDAPGVVISASRPNNADAAGAYAVGQTTVTWTATDAGGLTATANQTVMVSDAERPSISAPAPVTVNTDPHSPAAVVTLSSAVATDNCPGVTVTGPTGANSYPIGTTTVSWTAIDAAGNTSSASSTITVIDNEPPTITVPASFTVNATMPTGAIVTYNIVASDNSGFASALCSRASGSVFAIGPTLVTCTATDGSGNTSAPTSFTITVRGAPEQIQNLITFVSGLSLPPGTSQPVLAMLATALRDPGAVSPQVGCSKLDDFITKLADHKAVASISVYAINQMIADATRIKGVLGCP